MCAHWSSLIFDGGFSPSFFRSDASIAVEGTPFTDVSFAGAHGASSVDDPSFAVDADFSVEHAASAAAARIAVANRDRIIGSLAFEFREGVRRATHSHEKREPGQRDRCSRRPRLFRRCELLRRWTRKRCDVDIDRQLHAVVLLDNVERPLPDSRKLVPDFAGMALR